MLNSDWEEVHYFIQRERDDTEDRLSVDKMFTKTMAVGEPQSKNSNIKEPVAKNVLPEVPRKPKMKVKAAKVFKYLLNFLQMKPKKKFEDTEKLCIPSTPQDSFAYENPESYEFHSLQMPNSTDCSKPDGMLSVSWSYLVHDPFKEVSNLEEETQNDLENEIFCDESYFEDDYWQDYRENDLTPFRTPVRNVQSRKPCSRLFEPERTPCGEFKRTVVTQGAPCRRHASLPNFHVDSPVFTASPADAHEINPDEVSDELLDFDEFLCNHPPVGLNIAFDNLLDETNSQSRLYSVNQVPFLVTGEIDQFEYSSERSVSETYICQPGTQNLDCSVSEMSQNLDYSASEISTNSDRTQQDYCIAGEYSIHNVQVSDQSTQSIHDSTQDVLISEMQSGSERCRFDMSVPASNCTSKSNSLAHVPCCQESTNTQRSSKQYRSVESGYSSSDSSPSLSPGLYLHPVVKDTGKSSDSYTLPAKATDIVSAFTTHNVLMNKQITFQQSPWTLTTKAGESKEIIQANAFQTSTSSPMQIINTPSFLNNTLLSTVGNFISPITQNVETPKMRHRTMDGRLKNHKRKESVAKVSRFHSRILDTNLNVELFCEDDLLITAAAELILNRIQLKEELQPYINTKELVAYLKSYYVNKIAKLPNGNVKSISDYKKITKEAFDTFTPERLTLTSCYCELLTAVLAYKPRIVSACEDFIFENLDFFVRSTDFLEAAPEVILMLLCNNRCTIFGTFGLPMKSKDLEHDLNTHLDNYIEKHYAGNFEKYFQIKNMFACIKKKRTDLNLNSVAWKTFSKVSGDQELECKISKHLTNKAGNEYHQSTVSSICSKAISNVHCAPVQTLCKGTRMFRNKQFLYRTQGSVPEIMQKLIGCGGDRKISPIHRSSHQSNTSVGSIHNMWEFARRSSVKGGKYNLLSNSVLPPKELSTTRIKSGRSSYAAKPSTKTACKRLTLSRPAVKYVTEV